MSGHVAFPLSDGEILTIRIAQEPGEIDLDQVRGGAILWGFDAFLGEKVAKNKFCEEILAWPYRRSKSLRGVRLEVSASQQGSSKGAGWLGGSFGLACAIAFSRSQSDGSINDWPLVVATGVMRRVGDCLLVDAVGHGPSFNQKLHGVLACAVPPEFFIYPFEQQLHTKDNELLVKIQEKGVKVLAVSSMTELYDKEICPRPPHGIKAVRGSDNMRATTSSRDSVQFYEDRAGDSDSVAHHPTNNTVNGRINRERALLQPNPNMGAPRNRETASVEVAARGLQAKPSSFNRKQAVATLLIPFLLVAAIFSFWLLTDYSSSKVQTKNGTDVKVVTNSPGSLDGFIKSLSVEDIESLTAEIDDEESLKKFVRTTEHKGWALSDSGKWNFFGDMRNASVAVGLAMETCRSRNLENELEFPCRVINVDDNWVKGFEPKELTYDLTGIDVLVKNKSARYFEETYEPITESKVIAASLSGNWAARHGAGASEILMVQALQRCQKNNEKYETQFPCRVVNVNGQWRDKPYLKDGAAGRLPEGWSIQADIENPFVEQLLISEAKELISAIDSSDGQVLSVYNKDKYHKAMAFSQAGVGGRGGGFSKPGYAATYAQNVCINQNKKKEVEFPCRVVNVDGMWVRDFEPREFPEDLVEEDQLITNSAIREYADSYTKVNHAKVFVASLTGKWATKDDANASLDQLGLDALEECRSKNKLLESKFPCRVINVNGLWVELDPQQSVDSDSDGIPDKLELKDGSDPQDASSYKDSDSDGVADRYEQLDGTDPLDSGSFKDSDGDGVSDRSELENDTRPDDPDSFLDTDKDDVPDYVELLSKTDKDDPNSYPDADGDSVPDRSELIDGTDPNDATSFKDTDGDSVPDRYEPFDINAEYLSRYQQKYESKALVSYDGKNTFTSGRTDSNAAARLAAEGCYLTNKIENDKDQCRVVNIDGMWIRNFVPPDLPDVPALSMITTKKALSAFNRYERFVGGAESNKAFVYSLGGWYSMDVDSRKSIEKLAGDLLQDCRRKNDFWESRYPCRVVNINGQWGVDSALVKKAVRLREENGSLTKEEVARLKETIDDPENVRRYDNVEGHKAWALSDNGTSYLSFKMTSIDLAMGLALTGCQLRNQESESEFPCRIVNVDGKWVKDIETSNYPGDLTGKDVLLKKTAQMYFEKIYEPISHNKVLVASLGGEWARGADPDATLEQLRAIALNDCQRENRRKETLFPCRVVNVNGQWRKNPFSEADSDIPLSALENPIVEPLPGLELEEIESSISTAHEKWYSNYRKTRYHKALAYSDSTAAGGVGSYVAPRYAARIALDSCRANNKKLSVEFPCRVVSVDGFWVKNYQPPELPGNLAEKDLLTTVSLLSKFENEYSKITHNRVFAASLTGVSVIKDGKNSPVDTLELEALKECRSDNSLLESKYPCRVININGSWVNDDRVQLTDDTRRKANIETGVSEVKRISDNANSRVEFNPDSVVLTARSRNILRTIADLMAQYPTTTLEINGFTDSYGDPARNLKLSKHRADACAAYIAAQGISLKRLKVFGNGAANPIASNSTREGRKRNRRVEFRLKE